jgi:hypothetical protein
MLSIIKNRLRRTLTPLALAFVALGLFTAIADAQAPFSGRVLAKHEAQARIDLQSHAVPTDRGGWVWGLPGVATGLDGGIEVAAGLSATNPRTSTDLTLAAKWAPLANTKSPVQFAVGTTVFIPTQQTPGLDRVGTTSFPYIAVTAPIAPALGEASPVLTLAAYGVNTPRPGPNTDRGGAMIGVEQGLPYGFARALGMDAAQAQVSWVTGKTMFGYASGGITFLKGDVNVSVGYARGNLPQFNHGPTFGIGVAF